MTSYDYDVTIMGHDYEDGEWASDQVPIRVGFGEDLGYAASSYDDAVAFVLGITEEQALEWERMSGCNGLDIVIYKEEHVDGQYTGNFDVVGQYSWIGTTRTDDYKDD